MKKTIYADYKLINSQNELSLENILESLLASGVDEILVKPVLMSDGFEAKKLRERVSAFEGRFSRIEFGVPVLGTLDSINNFAELLIQEIGFSSEYEYCLVGHGLSGSPNREYFQLSETIHSKGFLNVEVACLTGEGNIDSYLRKLQDKIKVEDRGDRPLYVYPLLINLGTHIKKDIFGTEAADGEKSFVQILEENGFIIVKNPVPLSQFESFRTRYLDENKNLSY